MDHGLSQLSDGVKQEYVGESGNCQSTMLCAYRGMQCFGECGVLVEMCGVSANVIVCRSFTFSHLVWKTKPGTTHECCLLSMTILALVLSVTGLETVPSLSFGVRLCLTLLVEHHNIRIVAQVRRTAEQSQFRGKLMSHPDY